MTKLDPETMIDRRNVDEHNRIIESVNELYDTVDNIEANVEDIPSMKEDIATNTSAISTNATNIVTLTSTVNGHTTTITANTDSIASITNAIKVLVSDIALTADVSTVRLTMTKQDTTAVVRSMPVANESQAGVLNQAMYNLIMQMYADIQALEQASQLIEVTGLTGTPTQAELLTAWRTATGSGTGVYPAVGTSIIQLDGTTTEYYYRYGGVAIGWYVPNTGINVATTTTLGVVKGSTAPGQIYIELDGTQSLNNYDGIMDAISDNTDAIALLNDTTIPGLNTAITNVQTQLDALVLSVTNVSVSSGSWVANSTDTDLNAGGYVYQYTISITNMLATMEPHVNLVSADFLLGNVAGQANTISGGIIIYSKTNDAITIDNAYGIVIS